MRLLIILFLLAAALPGCANWSTYNKQRSFEETGASAVFVDAKQRAILSNAVPLTPGAVPGPRGMGVTSGSVMDGAVPQYATTGTPDAPVLRRFCAEPSPDALSAFSARAGLDLAVASKGDLGYQQAFSEGAASIGLRTQSIQLLRDIMFTNCEAFLNNGITEFGLETLQRRFQSTLVGVLAIEQLTGAVRAPSVVIGSATSTNNAQVLADAIALVDTANTALEAARKDQASKDAAAIVDKTALDTFIAGHVGDQISDEYKAAKEKADKSAAAAKAAAQVTETRSTDLAEAKKVRAAATEAGGTTAVTGKTEAAPSGFSEANAAAVSQAVVQIVDSVLSLGFGRELCTTLLGQQSRAYARAEKVSKDMNPFVAECVAYLREDVELARAITRRYVEEGKNAGKVLELSADLIKLVQTGKMKGDTAAQIIAALHGNAPVAEDQTPAPPLKNSLAASPAVGKPSPYFSGQISPDQISPELLKLFMSKMKPGK